MFGGGGSGCRPWSGRWCRSRLRSSTVSGAVANVAGAVSIVTARPISPASVRSWARLASRSSSHVGASFLVSGVASETRRSH